MERRLARRIIDGALARADLEAGLEEGVLGWWRSHGCTCGRAAPGASAAASSGLLVAGRSDDGFQVPRVAMGLGGPMLPVNLAEAVEALKVSRGVGIIW